jgi:hypothetical protein
MGVWEYGSMGIEINDLRQSLLKFSRLFQSYIYFFYILPYSHTPILSSFRS